MIVTALDWNLNNIRTKQMGNHTSKYETPLNHNRKRTKMILKFFRLYNTNKHRRG